MMPFNKEKGNSIKQFISSVNAPFFGLHLFTYAEPTHSKHRRTNKHITTHPNLETHMSKKKHIQDF
jgi:hypothetical protein